MDWTKTVCSVILNKAKLYFALRGFERVFFAMFCLHLISLNNSFGSSRLCETGQLGIFIHFLYFSYFSNEILKNRSLCDYEWGTKALQMHAVICHSRDFGTMLKSLLYKGTQTCRAWYNQVNLKTFEKVVCFFLVSFASL